MFTIPQLVGTCVPGACAKVKSDTCHFYPRTPFDTWEHLHAVMLCMSLLLPVILHEGFPFSFIHSNKIHISASGIRISTDKA